MITSDQVSALVAQQQAQQQIMGQSSFMGTAPPMLGTSQYPPQFGFNYNAGQNAGVFSTNTSHRGGMMSSMSGLMGGGLMSAAGNTMMSMAGMTALASGFGIGGATVGGTAGMLLGANPLTLGLLAAGAPLAFAGNAMSKGAQQYGRNAQLLGGMTFANAAGSMYGRGFSHTGLQQMTDAQIGMAAANPFMTRDDTSQMMKSFTDLGLNTGVTNMGKMIDKFKEFSDLTETVARQMGKSISEVTGLVHQMHAQGFYTKEDVMGATVTMRQAQGMGISNQAMMGTMGAGASMARGMGYTGQSGARFTGTMTTLIAGGAGSGMLDADLLRDITGQADIGGASTAFAQKAMGEIGGLLKRPGAGQALLAGLAKLDDDGNMVLDRDAVRELESGRMSFEKLRSRAMTFAGQNQAKFRSGSSRLASDLLSSEGGFGASMGLMKAMANDAAKSGNMTEEEAFKLIAQSHTSFGELETDMLLEIDEQYAALRRKNLTGKAQEIAAQIKQDHITRNASFEGFMARSKHSIGKYLSPLPLENLGTRLTAGTERAFAQMEDRMFGTMEKGRTLGMYTDTEATQKVLQDYVAGDPDFLGHDTISGGMTRFDDAVAGAKFSDLVGAKDMTDALRIAGAARGDTDTFMSAVTSNLSVATKEQLDAVDLSSSAKEISEDIAVFNETTNYEKMAQGTAVSKLFHDDDESSLERLRQLARRYGAQGADEEAYLINRMGGGAALKRMASKQAQEAGAQTGTDFFRDQFLDLTDVGTKFSGAAYTGMTLGTGALVVGGIAGGLATAGVMAKTGGAIGTFFGGPIGTGLGAVAGGLVGLGLGMFGFSMMSEHDEAIDAINAGVGTGLFSKVNGPGDLRAIDTAVVEGMGEAGGDESKGYEIAAKKLKGKFGTVSAGELKGAMDALKSGTGKGPNERRMSGDYSQAMKIAMAGKAYRQNEQLTQHLSSMHHSLAGVEAAGIDGLKAALASGDTRAAQAEMVSLAKAYREGDLELTADAPASLRQLAGSKEMFSELMKYKGMDISALDERFGDGAGAQLRKLAGITNTGVLREDEIAAMADKASALKALKAEGGGAMNIAAGGGDSVSGTEVDSQLTAQLQSLTSSTNELAIYVDNIGSALTGIDPIQRKARLYDNIDKKKEEPK